MNAQDHPIDVHVGMRVRLRRKMLGKSQETLAEALGITFQQVQKYERGSNRISASKLYRIAQVLEVPISYFFDGFSHREGSDVSGYGPQPGAAFLATNEGLDLAMAFPLISSGKQRQQILALVRSMGEH